ncbi:MAG: N-formylglutamate amidohydrolase [Beijerinckiaceae bacterium]|jgi:N-formylglutamate amidohydrolase|nr:N-formylglutamate amidohydrolase [Beijerinckiaceae bacterium]
MTLPRIETDETYTLLHPQGGAGVPVLVNSPHSGEVFPEAFLARSQLSRQVLRRASDLYVDRLVERVACYGATVMFAHLPRSFVDLNREPLELDPRLISGALPVEANTRSLRVAGGLGTVPRVIGDQVEIYAGKIALDEALSRIERFYLPYHGRLHRNLGDLRARFGRACLIDCHSMPSNSRSTGLMPDLVLGDRFGASCRPELIESFEALARQEGFRVERNQPYAGGYITECYGRPELGWDAFQIEINRALYMDERTLEPHSGFAVLARRLENVFAKFFAEQAFENRTTDLHFYQKAAE